MWQDEGGNYGGLITSGRGTVPVGPPLLSHCALSPSPDPAEGLCAPKGGGRDVRIIKVEGLEKIHSVPTNII